MLGRGRGDPNQTGHTVVFYIKIPLRCSLSEPGCAKCQNCKVTNPKPNKPGIGRYGTVANELACSPRCSLSVCTDETASISTVKMHFLLSIHLKVEPGGARSVGIKLNPRYNTLKILSGKQCCVDPDP